MPSWNRKKCWNGNMPMFYSVLLSIFMQKINKIDQVVCTRFTENTQTDIIPFLYIISMTILLCNHYETAAHLSWENHQCKLFQDILYSNEQDQ